MPQEKQTKRVPKGETQNHPSMTAMEVTAFQQLLSSEEKKRVMFRDRKSEYVRPRNPLTGEATPRAADGEVVLNPNAFYSVVGGVPLFPSNYSYEPSKVVTHSNATGKIGIIETKYDTLGNKGIEKALAQPEDLYKRAQEEQDRKNAVQREKDKLRESKLQISLQRKEKDLEAEILLLKRQMESKELELKYLRKKLLPQTD